MSSRFRVSYLALSAVLTFAAVACVDPKKEFGDFEDRVVDAAPPSDSAVGTGFFPVNGEFLVAIQPSLGGMPIRLVVTAATTESPGGGGTVDLTFQPLVFETCSPGMGGQPAGDPLPALTAVPLNADGTFTITQADAATPAAANSITCGEILVDLVITGRTISEDLFCGDVMLNVKVPDLGELTGTLGAIRIETGTRGDANLPSAVTSCPATEEPDAGVIDAAAEDADVPDATVADER
jgi:hypothetical protein